MRRFLFSFLMSTISFAYAQAADLYVVQGRALGQTVSVGNVPEMIIWSTNAFFYNRGATDALVRLRGVSNGSLSNTAPSEFTLPAQRSTSLSSKNLDALWRPLTSDPLWVLHLDVSDEILVDDALFVRGQSQLLPNPTFNPEIYKYGKIRLPVFTSLIPANQPQISLATSLGDPAAIPSHSNVAIYNGGSAAGTARIDVRRHCDDSLVESRTVTIAANTIIQVINLPSAGECSTGPPAAPPSSVYTIVTIDQPSFSFVSNVANNFSPLTSLSITGSH